MKKRVSEMRAITLSFLVCLILACNIILRMEASNSVSIGIIYHPDDGLLAQMLRERVRFINKTLSHQSYPKTMLNIDLISIKSTSSKELLPKGEWALKICLLVI